MTLADVYNQMVADPQLKINIPIYQQTYTFDFMHYSFLSEQEFPTFWEMFTFCFDFSLGFDDQWHADSIVNQTT